MTFIHTALIALGAACLPMAAIRPQCGANVQHLLNARKFAVARAQLDARLARNDKNDALLDCRGRVELEAGKADDAVTWLEKAVALNPGSAAHHEALGLALRATLTQANMFEQMRLGPRMKAELEEAVRIDATLVDARGALLDLFAQAPAAMGGSIDKAREHAAELLKVNAVRGHMGFARIAEQGKDYATAEKEFLAAITARPDSEVAYSAAGGFYRRRERWADAIGMYRKQLAAMPKDPSLTRMSNLHYSLGLSLQGSGRPDLAKPEFQAAVAANPDNANAAKALASLP
jgi:tetratricopeptide (TPR) repeat protein